MNRDHFKGIWHQFKGEAKKQWGKLTDDDLKQIDGDFEKYQGIMQQQYADQKDKVKEWTDRWFAEHPWEDKTKRQVSS